MSTIRITADSTCDLSPELIRKYDFGIMPLFVGLGDTYGKDGIDVFPEDIYKYVKETGVLPKTAAGTIPDYEAFFRQYTDKGETVIHFNISSGFSSTHQNARLAAEEIGSGVYVVDSLNLSTGTAHLMLDAADMLCDGMDAESVVEAVRERASLVRTSFVVDTLDYLRMGGRCSAVSALGANLLKLHPCIEVRDGGMVVGTKYRGPLAKVIRQYALDKLTKTENIRMKNVFITHTNCDEDIVAAVREIVETHASFENIYETKAGATVNSHCGQGTLGVLFEVDK